MQFTFDKKLKELRNANGVTQEQLSAHLSISPQAVSKWERGEGYPDITLLPRIAAFFGITVDELLGTDKVRIDEKIEQWKEKSRNFRSSGDMLSDVAVWEEAYGEYPHELEIMGEYIHALWRECDTHWSNDEVSRRKAEKIVAIAEEILARSTKNRDRDHAVQILAYVYDRLGNKEAAVRYAQMQSEFWTCREAILCDVLDEDHWIGETQKFITELADCLALTIERIIYRYPAKERIEIAKYQLGLYRGLFVNGDYCWYSSRMRQFSRRLSQFYLEAGDRANGIKALSDAASFAKMYDDLDVPGNVVHHTSPLVDTIVWESKHGSKNYSCSESALVLDAMQNKEYDAIRTDPDFIRIKEDLEKRAVK